MSLNVHCIHSSVGVVELAHFGSISEFQLWRKEIKSIERNRRFHVNRVIYECGWVLPRQVFSFVLYANILMLCEHRMIYVVLLQSTMSVANYFLLSKPVTVFLCVVHIMRFETRWCGNISRRLHCSIRLIRTLSNNFVFLHLC